MFPRASLPVPPDTLCTCLNYLSLHRRLDELDEIVGEAVQAWLANAKADGFLQRPATVRGYQWKELFLPDGTRLRSRNCDEFMYAEVDGDDIKFDGQSMSPMQPSTVHVQAPGKPVPALDWDGIDRREGYRRQEDLLLD